MHFHQTRPCSNAECMSGIRQIRTECENNRVGSEIVRMVCVKDGLKKVGVSC